MSLIVATYVPRGIIMGADSRSVATLRRRQMEGETEIVEDVRFVNSDASEKLFLVQGRVGIGIWGDLFIGGHEVGEYIRAFEREHLDGRHLSTEAMARELAAFFRALNPLPDVSLLLCGYDENVAHIWSVETGSGEVQRQNNPLGSGKAAFGVIRGGDTQVLDRLLGNPRQNPQFDIMALQTGVDFTRHLIQCAVDHTAFEPGLSTIGGPVDVLLLSQSGGRFLSQKQIR